MNTYLWEVRSRKFMEPIATSTNVSPHFYLPTGVYDVELTITTPGNGVFNIVKERYIVITDEMFNMINGQYIDSHVSYTLGLDNSTGTGWSENRGEHWIMPESHNAILTKQINGRSTSFMWDMTDNKQYIVDVAKSNNFSDMFFDKDIYPIATIVKTQNMVGGLQLDTLEHQETTVSYTPTDGLRDHLDGFKVDMALFVNGIPEPVDYKSNVESLVDVTFYYQHESVDSHTSQQIGIYTSHSGFVVDKIETMFKQVRKSRAASTAVDDNYSKINEYTQHWLTRGDYTRDRITGLKLSYINHTTFEEFYVESPNDTTLTGPDGIVDSGIHLSRPFTPMVCTGKNIDILFWSTRSLTGIDGYDTNEITISGNWILYKLSGTFDESFTFPVGITLFDIRMIDPSQLTPTAYTEMIEKYYTNISRYLPRF